MTSAFLWVFVPLGLGLVLVSLHRFARISMTIGIAVCLLLALSAMAIEVDRTYFWGGIPVKLTSEMVLLGRTLALENTDRAAVLFLNLICAFWLLIGLLFDPIPSFAGYGVSMAALLIGAVAVQPFLFAALFVIMAVLISLPLLIRLPDRQGRAEVYYLIFMTLSLPFLLLAGWAADGVEANPLDAQMFSYTLVLFAIGFSLLLAAFPFVVWVPKIASQVRPVRVFFLLSLMPSAFFLIFQHFLRNYAWLGSSGMLSNALSFSGLVLIVFSGVWSAFQDDLGRLFGFAVLFENGFAFLALSVSGGVHSIGLILLFFGRLIGFAVWGAAAAVLSHHGTSFHFDALKGLLHRSPAAAIGILSAYFSVGGLPLLAGFSTRMFLVETLAVNGSLNSGLWLLVGQIGFLVGGLRLFSAFLKKKEMAGEPLPTAWFELLLLGLGVIVLLIVGIFPSQFFGLLTNFLAQFQYLPG
ncbi:MAG: hypothetical protein HPY85_13720 [Anaerolineae bacterium]|nr:hypothetical protein [Anaerolineae bacterium]